MDGEMFELRRGLKNLFQLGLVRRDATFRFLTAKVEFNQDRQLFTDFLGRNVQLFCKLQ